MKVYEPWPQNLKYFQQELKIYCNFLHIFLKFFKKQKEQEGQFYFQKFYRYIWLFIILANTTTKIVTRNKETRHFAMKGVTMADQKD